MGKKKQTNHLYALLFIIIMQQFCPINRKNTDIFIDPSWETLITSNWNIHLLNVHCYPKSEDNSLGFSTSLFMKWVI